MYWLFSGVNVVQSQSVDSTDAPWDRDVTVVASSNNNDSRSRSNPGGRQKTVDNDIAETNVTRTTVTNSTVVYESGNSRLTGAISYRKLSRIFLNLT